jgi:hypothetical protein
MHPLRKAFAGLQISPAVEKVLDDIERKKIEDESYIQFLESLVPIESVEASGAKSDHRKRWEKSRNLSGPATPSGLEATQEKILVCISGHGETTVDYLVKTLALNETAVEYHLKELESKRMVKTYYAVESPVFWALDHEGRGYLVRQNLLP